MLGKHQKLLCLFEKAFDCKSLKVQKHGVKFKCKKKCACKVNDDEPKWTAALGDEGTRVMVVGEAPSSTDGKGAHVAGRFKEFISKSKNETNLDAVCEFAKKLNGNKTPYFTDVAKCGFSKQSDKERKHRIRTCIKYLLIEEILIIKPKSILCFGGRAFEELSKYIEEHKGEREEPEKKILEQVTLIRLLHYSDRASIKLPVKYKRDIVWKYQAGLLSEDELQSEDIKKEWAKVLFEQRWAHQ